MYQNVWTNLLGKKQRIGHTVRHDFHMAGPAQIVQ
jgi:hypothetical protein